MCVTACYRCDNNLYRLLLIACGGLGERTLDYESCFKNFDSDGGINSPGTFV